jgi:hypothetical protein
MRCECGCGEITAIATRTDTARGWTRGVHVRFRKGHAFRVLSRDRSDPRARFWEKVRKSDGGCWEWTATMHRGYGIFREDPGMPMKRAHRLSFEWAHGPIPEGHVIMHSCDNKKCVNPAHLSAGPQAENVRQAVERDLVARGEQKPQRKLTERDVVSIREQACEGKSMASLALEFGVSSPTIQSIVHRRKWRHVA